MKAMLVVVPALPRPASADTLDCEQDANLAGCPSSAAFVASIRSRTDQSRFDGKPGRAVRVRLQSNAARSGASSSESARGEAVIGSLIVETPGAEPSVREVDGATCAVVTDAMSLIFALAIDAHARPTPPVAESAPAPKTDTVIAAHPPSPVPAPRKWETRLGAEVTGARGAAPSTLLGAALSVDVIPRPRASSWSPFVVPAAWVRFGGERTPFEVAGPTADITRITGAFSLCPLRMGSGGIEIASCGGTAFGAVRVEGVGTDAPGAKTRAWSHLEASLRGQITLATDCSRV